MKDVIIIFTGFVLLLCFSYFVSTESIAPIILFGVCIVAFILYKIIDKRKKHKKWQTNPIPADTSDFEQFFWALDYNHQDWYIENILKEKGMDFLINKYKQMIVDAIQSPTLELDEQIRIIYRCSEKLNYLNHFAEFYRPQQ